LNDPDPWVRAVAVRSLSRQISREDKGRYIDIINELKRMSKKDEEKVKRQARLTLEMLGERNER
jgi:hypothetical protein